MNTLPIPRHLLPGDERYVRDIYRICYPREPRRPSGWYFANPTLVMEDTGRNNLLVAFTSFTLADGNGALTLYGKDVCVLPEYRGRGFAKALHAARLTIGQSLGAKVFVGSTKDPGMATILVRAGAHKCIPIGEAGHLYMGLIEEV